jgi:hypothetical protein
MKMARPIRKILKILGWILAGCVSLILLITLGFYLGRGWIMKRAVDYLNKNQPGEVQMGQMNLIPFLDFPNAVLQLHNVSYYEKPVRKDSLYQEPILYLNDIYLSLDVVELARGGLKVSQARFENGFFRIEVYKDSVTNLEYALGIRFGEEAPGDTVSGMPAMRIDLQKIELTNILALMDDRTCNDRLNLLINHLESKFSYLPEMIEAGIELNININEVKIQKYSLENKEGVHLKSQAVFDPVRKKVQFDPSLLEISGLELETWGSYEFIDQPRIDLAFRATNQGLDVLNFLFLGVLDLEEIEQIGGGSIYLNGSVTGPLGEQLPVLRLNGSADHIGFRIKSIKRDVSDISFTLFATNGGESDLSEVQVSLRDFTASFPEGTIRGDIEATNFVTPEIDIAMDGELDLEGLDHMINSDMLRELKGHLTLNGRMNGIVNRPSAVLLDEEGTFSVKAENVGFKIKNDTVTDLNGEIQMAQNAVGTEGLSIAFNGSRFEIEAKVENILLYLLGYERDVKAEISLSSDLISLGRILQDTSISQWLGNDLKGLHFKAGAYITHDELDKLIRGDSIPRIELALDSFGLELPEYASISNMRVGLNLGPNTLSLQYMDGTVGESSFHFAATATGYQSLLNRDSGGIVGLDYLLASDLMRAKDFLTVRGVFILPETYLAEFLENFHMEGSLDIPVMGLLNDSAALDFGVKINTLGCNYSGYPHAFEDFRLMLRKKGNELIIDEFQGKVGASNLKMAATVGNFTDSLRENLYGEITIESELLDVNELLISQVPEEEGDTTSANGPEEQEPLRLDQINYPDIGLNLNIGELRYGDYRVLDIKGRVGSSKEKVIYLDHLTTSTESGGTIDVNGQFNVSDPEFYNFSAEFNLKEVNINDLAFEMQSGEETYTLKENFAGLVSTTGLAEIFISPDMKLDISTTTAMFNVQVTDGALINFTPLKAAGKYLDNKDLNRVRFSTLRNNFTLMDSKIIIPLMIVESTIGQILIEGEQGLDNAYLYLLHVPTWLVKEAAKSSLSKAEDDNQEDQIHQMKMGNFLMLTAWSDGVTSEVKLGDKREKYRK